MAKRTTKKKSMKKASAKKIEALTHAEAKRRNIPTAEFQSVMEKDDQSPIRVAYDRRNRDLDPQLVWRGKDEQDWSDLVVQAPPLFIQEKVHPKVLVDDLRRQSEAAELARKLASGEAANIEEQLDLFDDFNGLPDPNAKTEFYEHDANWTNRMVLGDSLRVMASMAEREGLRGQVQCIYLDPPYGIKFNSNFQWSTTSRDVKDGKAEHITREPEQVKAFRDTWRDGIHSYLTYLRDRLTVCRDLLRESGSIFVQIGVENLHLVRSLLDECFGAENFRCQIAFRKKAGSGADTLPMVADYIVWYAKNAESMKYRQLFKEKSVGSDGSSQYTWLEREDSTRSRVGLKAIASGVDESKVFRPDKITNARPAGTGDLKRFCFEGREFGPGSGTFLTHEKGLGRLDQARRLVAVGNTLSYVRFIVDFPAIPLNSLWDDTSISGFGDPKVYVVQTLSKVVQRCILMATDPGDLVLDPTCGSGTTAFVAEQWGRRWITIDTSRVSLALARARIMGSRYPYYFLADSMEGVEKEAEVARDAPPDDYKQRYYAENIRHGFVYKRVPHITLRSIANNTEIDVIHEQFQAKLEPLREKLNKAIKQKCRAIASNRSG